MTRPSVCGSCSLPMSATAPARQVGAEVARPAHERLAADGLAGHQLLDEVAAQPRLGLGAHLLAGALERAGVRQLGQRRLDRGRAAARRSTRPARRSGPRRPSRAARLRPGISSSMNGPIDRRRPVPAGAHHGGLEHAPPAPRSGRRRRAGRGTRRGSRPARRGRARAAAARPGEAPRRRPAARAAPRARRAPPTGPAPPHDGRGEVGDHRAPGGTRRGRRAPGRPGRRPARPGTPRRRSRRAGRPAARRGRAAARPAPRARRRRAGRAPTPAAPGRRRPARAARRRATGRAPGRRAAPGRSGGAATLLVRVVTAPRMGDRPTGFKRRPPRTTRFVHRAKDRRPAFGPGSQSGGCRAARMIRRCHRPEKEGPPRHAQSPPEERRRRPVEPERVDRHRRPDRPRRRRLRRQRVRPRRPAPAPAQGRLPPAAGDDRAGRAARPGASPTRSPPR